MFGAILECHIELGLLALLSTEAQAGHKVVCFPANFRFVVVSVAIDRKLFVFFFEKYTLVFGWVLASVGRTVMSAASLMYGHANVVRGGGLTGKVLAWLR